MSRNQAVERPSRVDQRQVEESVWSGINDEESGEVVKTGLVEPHDDVHLPRRKNNYFKKLPLNLIRSAK